MKRAVIIALLVAAPLAARAQDQDTVKRAIHTEYMNKPMVVNQQGISGTVNVEKIHAIPSFLGNADPIRFARLLPSIQLNTEIDGGLYMQGSEHSHTLVSMGGVPVYGASHLLGLFSVFNSPHYKGMRYATSAGREPRLGGLIDMELVDTLVRKTGGEASLGLMSAQGTIRLSTGKNSSIIISARQTYLNLLYGSFLKYNDASLKYGFTDGNITWLWRPGPRDKVWIDVFGCRDAVTFDYGSANADMDASWYNGLGAVHWNHYFEDLVLKQTAYFTMNGLNARAAALGAWGSLPSSLATAGYKAEVEWKGWEFAAGAAYHRDQPQNPDVEGYHNNANNAGVPVQHGVETILDASYSRDLGLWLQAKAGLGLVGLVRPGFGSWWGLTPRADLILNLMEYGKVDLHYGLRRQNIFQLGFTNNGFPVEFYVLAGSDYSAPQYSHNISLSYNAETPRKGYSISAEIYAKWLFNQLEYVGTMMEILNASYRLQDSLLQGDGLSWGLNLMLQKQTGRLSGWIGYAFARSLRNFNNPNYPGTYPSNHERLHELDIVATYDLGRWDVGATLVAASGTPYTQPESFYIIGDRIICVYGEHNAHRLPMYMRMDASANWYIKKTQRQELGLNVSVYNVLGNENTLGYAMMFNKEKEGYEYSPARFRLKFMPSLAVFYRF